MDEEFEIGDLVTSPATGHAIIYSIKAVNYTNGYQRVEVATKEPDGSEYVIHGDFSANTFRRCKPPLFSQDDVDYYEAVTERIDQ